MVFMLSTRSLIESILCVIFGRIASAFWSFCVRRSFVESDSVSVRNAAKALIIKDDKMLAIKISDGKEEWYIMPGGGQDVEELLPEAVCREVAEEMGLRVVVKDLAFVIEGLHGEKFHRVDLVFLCEYIGKLENAVLQSDTVQVGYDWLDIKTLNTTPLYPSKLRRQIMNLYEGKAYKVYLGNEEIGDPEVTD